MTMIERYTLGEIRKAGRKLGDEALLGRVLQGSKVDSQAACRFLTTDPELCVQCSERAECHGVLAS